MTDDSLEAERTICRVCGFGEAASSCGGRHCAGSPAFKDFERRCANCRHSLPFHGGSKMEACKAYGCSCPGWQEDLGLVLAWQPNSAQVRFKGLIQQDR